METPIWLSFGKAFLAGGASYLGMLLAQSLHASEKRVTRRRLETAFAAALGAAVAVAVVVASSYDGFLGGLLALGVIVLLHLGMTRAVRSLQTEGVQTKEQVAALILGEANTIRLFYADARATVLLKQNGTSDAGPPRGRNG